MNEPRVVKRRTVAWLLLGMLALGIVVTAPLIVAVAHQRRIDTQSTAIDKNADAIARLARVEKRLDTDRVHSDFQACLARLSTWQIASSFVLYETSPGKERETLLSFLPPRPKCIDPGS